MTRNTRICGFIIRIHDNRKKRELCNICDRMYVNLKDHNTKVHTNSAIEKENCLLCGKDVSNLKAHQERIHGEINKNYQCDICGYKSANKHALKKHSEAMHTNVQFLKSLNCPYCEKSYKHKTGLVVHIQKYHEKGTQNIC